MALSDVLHDARRDAGLTLRMLARRPAFAAVALVTLALGIGAPTAVFTVVNAVLLKPLPFQQPDRVVAFRIDTETPAGPSTFDALPVAEALDWSASSATLAALAVYNDRALTLSTPDGPFRLSGISATPNLFEVLRATPASGRIFQERDADARQIVLSDATWRAHFGANPAVINSNVMLDGDAYRVVGVMPADFRFPTPEAAFWMPQEIGAGGSRGMVLPAVARLRDDATIAAVEQEGARVLGDTGDARIRQTLHVRSLQEQMVGGTRRVLWVMMAAVSLVSIIATMNIAMLLLTHGATRAREFSVRLALGAGRGRVMRQLFVEGLTLGLIGGVCGLALAGVGVRLLVMLAPPDLPRLQDTSIDLAVVMFAAAITVTASVVFGILSAGRIVARQSRLVAVAPRRSRLNALAATELALTVVLLVGAAVLLRSFVGLLLEPQGFNPRGAVAFQVSLPKARYPSAEARRAFLDRLQDQLAHVAGVYTVGLAAELPTRQPTGRFAFAADPADLTGDPMTMPVFDTRMVGEGFIEAMGIPLVAGRSIAAADRPESDAVIVVSRLLAQRQFGDRDPIGAMLYSGSGNRRVVGVVEDVRPAAEGAEIRPAAYVPLRQAPDLLEWHSGMHVIARADGPATLTASLRAAVLSLDPNMPAHNLRLLSDDVSKAVAAPRFAATVLSAFAAIALVMAAVGVYGVLAHIVAQRTREIGVRMALGATRGRIIGLMMRDGAVVVSVGLAAGLLTAVWCTQALTSLLHAVTPVDPIAMGMVSVVLCAAGALAAYLPARRAARVNVVAALKTDF